MPYEIQHPARLVLQEDSADDVALMSFVTTAHPILTATGTEVLVSDIEKLCGDNWRAVFETALDFMHLERDDIALLRHDHLPHYEHRVTACADTLKAKSYDVLLTLNGMAISLSHALRPDVRQLHAVRLVIRGALFAAALDGAHMDVRKSEALAALSEPFDAAISNHVEQGGSRSRIVSMSCADRSDASACAS